MTIDKSILGLVKSGSPDEIGKAIIDLARLKDPGHQADLRALMRGPDQHLATMAAYALGESGDPAGMEYLQNLLQIVPAVFNPTNSLTDLNTLLKDINQLHDSIDNALSLYNRSYCVQAKAKLLDVLKVYSNEIPKQSVPHFDELVSFSVRKTRGLLLDALAICEFSLGNIEEALHYNMEAVTLGQETGDPQLLKLAYADLGHIHISLGNYYSALELLHQSLDIDDATNDPWRKRNRTVSNLARLYYVVGLPDKALEYAQEALELAEKELDLIGKANNLNTAGVLLTGAGEFEEAESCLKQSLDLAVNQLKNKALQGLVLQNLAYLHFAQSEIEAAAELLNDALVLATEMSDKATQVTILSNMALVELESGNMEEAEKLAEKALSLSREIEDISGQVDALWILGSIAENIHEDHEKAYGLYKEAIDLSEGLRKNLILDDFKISFAGNHINLYQQMVSLCVRMGKAEEAFQYMERSKSRALVDMLAGLANHIYPKNLSDAKLKKLESLKGKLDLLKRQIGSGHTSHKEGDGRAAIAAELRELEREYLKTFDNFKRQDPQWASLVSVDAVDMTTAQSILDNETLLLAFYQAGNETIIMAIGKDGQPMVHRLSIDPQEEADHVFALFAAISEGMNTDTRSHEYIKKIKQPLAHFYELLIAPIAALIEEKKHVIISPHQFWHYLPFQALWDRAASEYLIDKVSVSYIPSATTLTFYQARPEVKSKSALILANPSGDLEFAEEEGRNIAAKFAHADVFVRSNATFEKLIDHSSRDVVHLACHGYFRGDVPLLSHLVLSNTNGCPSDQFMITRI